MVKRTGKAGPPQMEKVVLAHFWTDTRDGTSYKPGDTVTVSAGMAAQLLNAGYAAQVTEVKASSGSGSSGGSGE